MTFVRISCSQFILQIRQKVDTALIVNLCTKIYIRVVLKYHFSVKRVSLYRTIRLSKWSATAGQFIANFETQIPRAAFHCSAEQNLNVISRYSRITPACFTSFLQLFDVQPKRSFSDVNKVTGSCCTLQFSSSFFLNTVASWIMNLHEVHVFNEPLRTAVKRSRSQAIRYSWNKTMASLPSLPSRISHPSIHRILFLIFHSKVRFGDSILTIMARFV